MVYLIRRTRRVKCALVDIPYEYSRVSEFKSESDIRRVPSLRKT